MFKDLQIMLPLLMSPLFLLDVIVGIAILLLVMVIRGH